MASKLTFVFLCLTLLIYQVQSNRGIDDDDVFYNSGGELLYRTRRETEPALDKALASRFIRSAKLKDKVNEWESYEGGYWWW